MKQPLALQPCAPASVDPLLSPAAPRESRARHLISMLRPYRYPAMAGVGLVALAIVAGPRWLGGPEVLVKPVVRQDFVQTIVASGHLEAPHRVTIGAQVVGTVKSVPVAEGQSVAANQVLVQLESSEWQAAAAQADLAVMQASSRLRQLHEVQLPVAQAVLREAQATQRNAHTQWQRNQALYQQSFIGKAALDDAQKAADVSEAQMRAAQAQLETAQPTGSDMAIAVSALSQARANADAARSRLRYATINAPAAGTLIDRSVEPGDIVQPGKTLMVLSPTGPSELVVQIDEKNLHLLALGQPALASADAYADQRFTARVSYINPGVDVQRGSVEVKLTVADPPAYLRQDMTVSIDIQVATRPNALLVPSDALHDADSSHPWVWVAEGGHAHHRSVKLGLRSAGMAEVLDGVSQGDLIAAVPSKLQEGSRLRARVAQAAH